MKFTGYAWKFGNDVDTDAILPAKYLNISDPAELAKHCMEGINSEFSQNVRTGDILVAGKNFGCGSSREHAPLSIKHAGIGAVIASSFARIFYRNAFNMSLPIIESLETTQATENGDELMVDLIAGLIINKTNDKTFKIDPIPEFMQNMLRSGGLLPYVRKQLSME